MPKLSDIVRSSNQVHLMSTITKQVPTNKSVIQAMSGKQKYSVKKLCTKLLKDYKTIASKRGSRSFDLGRWLANNV